MVEWGNPDHRVEAAKEGNASKGLSVRGLACCASVRQVMKLGEPHGRLQGAINLQGILWRKPSKSGGTTRTERARRLAPQRRDWLRLVWSGHKMLMSAKGDSMNPMRGVRTTRGTFG
jgi:hypothetical protein